MSSLLLRPATWPHLNLDPEPMDNSMDSISRERWYPGLIRHLQMSYQVVEKPKANIYAYLHNRMKKCPASAPHRRT